MVITECRIVVLFVSEACGEKGARLNMFVSPEPRRHSELEPHGHDRD